MLTQDKLKCKINEIEKLIKENKTNIAFKELEEFFVFIKEKKYFKHSFEEEKLEDFEKRIEYINQLIKFLFDLKLQNKDLHLIDKMLNDIKLIEKEGLATSYLTEELTRSLVYFAIKSNNNQYLKRAKNLDYKVFVDELIKIAEEMRNIKDKKVLKAHIKLIKLEVPDLDEQPENLKRIKHILNKIDIEYDEFFKIDSSMDQTIAEEYEEGSESEEKHLNNLIKIFQDSAYTKTDIGNKICFILKRLYNREDFSKIGDSEIYNQILYLFEMLFEFKFSQDLWNNWNVYDETLNELNNFYFHLEKTFAFLIKKFEQKNSLEAKSIINFLIDKYQVNREKKAIKGQIEFRIYHLINIIYHLIIDNTNIFKDADEKIIFFLSNLLHKIPFIHNLTFNAVEMVLSLLDLELYFELINFEVMKNLELINKDDLPNDGASFIKQNLENLDRSLILEIREYCNIKNLKRIEHYLFSTNQISTF